MSFMILLVRTLLGGSSDDIYIRLTSLGTPFQYASQSQPILMFYLKY